MNPQAASVWHPFLHCWAPTAPQCWVSSCLEQKQYTQKSGRNPRANSSPCASPSSRKPWVGLQGPSLLPLASPLLCGRWAEWGLAGNRQAFHPSPFPDWVVLASPQSLAPETPASSLTRLRHIHESFLSPNVLKIKRATPGPTPPYRAAHLPPSVPLSQ